MRATRSVLGGLLPKLTMTTAMVLASCGAPPDDAGEVQTGAGAAIIPVTITPDQRLAACKLDQRVKAGLVTPEICAGADIFFRETFGGNGRTCGSCHPASHNFTIDRTFINNLFATHPEDPLFVFRNDPTHLAGLEREEFFFNGGILENVDGFGDPTHRFVGRSVPHVLSMATSIAPDTTDLSTNPPRERTGWGGDGAPGTGTLREFLSGAIKQHYTKTLARTLDTDFRDALPKELDFTLAFQMNLGRLNELNLDQVRLFDADAELGRQAYIDPQRGRCNFCHFNGGANAQLTGKNANFDTGVRFRPIFGGVGTTPDGVNIFDAGFGGANLTSPNITSFPRFPGDTILNGFGNNTFNTPPLIEFADTMPGFHNDSADTPEAVVAFYTGTEFRNSQASIDLVARFGTQIAFSDADAARIARFIRVLNTALNLDMAKQRLNAAKTLASMFNNTKPELQTTLMTIALGDINDALEDISPTNAGLQIQPFYPVTQDRLALAKTEIQAGLAATTWQVRKDRISNAVSRVENARDQIGSNITFQLGKGNVMF